MTPEQFVNKWEKVEAKETAVSQTHFNELCELLGVDKPLDVDPTGAFYTFEKHLSKSTKVGKGYADVWYRNHFAWEYKGKRKDLTEAYRQVVAYHEDLGNPPLLIVSDINTIEIHTKFTSTQKVLESFTLKDLLEPEKRSRLKKAWLEPQAFNPADLRASVTEATVRDLLARVADVLKSKGHNPDEVAHFLVKIVFTMFAEDAKLLPKYTFSQLLESAQKHPEDFKPMAEQLFGLMAGGGVSVVGRVPHFNGEIFSDASAPELGLSEITALLGAARQDWTKVEPSIFGTLFERIIDPAKRAQAGAHYTPPADILDVVGPVVLEPLRKEWRELSEEIEPLIQAYEQQQQGKAAQRNVFDAPLGEEEKNEAASRLRAFLKRLSEVRVLDPACGSGNFLYMTMQALMSLEEQVRAKLMNLEKGQHVPTGIHPNQFYGLEFNRYAHEIAGMVLWIGYLQWLRAHGEAITHTPILQKLTNLQNVDAVLDGDKPREWPEVDYIVGNPPFLGDKRMRSELGDEYVERLRHAYEGRVPGQADFVCYWFEEARSQVEMDKAERVGLLATNSIRGGANRTVLERIKDTGDIFMAWADREWVQEGAAVRVSIVGFDDGSDAIRTLDGQAVEQVNPDLTSNVDVTIAERLEENGGRSFIGIQKGGAFDIPGDLARSWFDLPNPGGKSNRDVLRPYVNGMDITRKPSDTWLIDFAQTSESEAEEYFVPFAYVEEKVKPSRVGLKRQNHARYWWRHQEARPGMRNALEGLTRYICTPRVAKHRFFVWLTAETLSDSRLVVIANDDAYTFGVLHSHIHEVWSLAQASWHGVGNDPTYNAQSCFETFPFPHPTDTQKAEIEKWAKYLDDVRRQLLDASKSNTMTGLYNELEKLRTTRTATHPVFPLLTAHEKLDAAVAAAYGWKWPLTEDEVLERLLALNLERAAAEKSQGVTPDPTPAEEDEAAA